MMFHIHPRLKEDTVEVTRLKLSIVLLMKDRSDAGMEEALRNFLREKLPGYKCPRWFEFVPELPKTPTGKIQRFKLRK